MIIFAILCAALALVFFGILVGLIALSSIFLKCFLLAAAIILAIVAIVCFIA
ncbi:MAG: hypothetical protein LUG25_03570 [Oscillospiraceae bacterium]|nr:hypothetical protein [Oscillospiraceae bacterium]